MAKISFCTFGCKVNQYETERAAEQARLAGHQVVPWGEPADVQIVHTCSITANAVRDGRAALRGALKRRRDGGLVLATGCAARTDASSLVPSPDVTVIEDLMEAVSGCGDAAVPPVEESRGDCLSCPSQRQARTRALVKIQDGCRFRCAFCIVPQARPVESSRPVRDVVEEVRAYVALGHREVVLTGVRITGYRPENAGRSGLEELIRRLGEVPGLARVRLTSLYPSEVREGLLRAMAESPNACPHLHLALQSGDDGILRRMRRAYTSARFLEVVEQARAILPGVAITTDVIAGFPGETEEAFENTAAVMRRAAFSRAHVFTFSPRPGTAAAVMDGQVPRHVARERTRRLIQIAAETGRAYRQGLVGSIQRVIVEQQRAPGILTGLTDSYVEVEFPAQDVLPGQEVKVSVTGVTEDGLTGVLAVANAA
jgi:threonylcarbamoyladenosine tRNA methylthiotransferase MtaB